MIKREDSRVLWQTLASIAVACLAFVFFASAQESINTGGALKRDVSNSTNVGIVATTSIPVTGAVTASFSGGFTETNAIVQFTNLIAQVDGLETLGIAQTNLLTGATNILLTIDADTGNIATSVSAIDTDATTIIGHVDGVEGLLQSSTNLLTGATNILLTIDADTGNIATSVAAIDTDATTIIGHVDGLEALGISQTNLLTGATNILLTIDADTGNIATSVAAIDTDATTIIGHVDGVETLLTSCTNLLTGATNILVTIDADTGTLVTQTADLDANTDGIEGQLTSIQAALDFQTNGVLMASGVTANGAVYSNLVKASAAKVYSINVGNTNGNQVLYGKVFNQASAVAVGGITPVYTFIVPGATNGAGNNVVFPNGGLALSSGFYLAITAGPATNDATAVTGAQVWGATYR